MTALKVKDRGLLDAAFFDALVEKRPAREEEIQALARRLSASPPPTPTPSNDDERSPANEALKGAYARRRAAVKARQDTTAIDEECRRLQALALQGPELHGGEHLCGL